MNLTQRYAFHWFLGLIYHTLFIGRWRQKYLIRVESDRYGVFKLTVGQNNELLQKKQRTFTGKDNFLISAPVFFQFFIRHSNPPLQRPDSLALGLSRLRQRKLCRVIILSSFESDFSLNKTYYRIYNLNYSNSST